MLRLQAFQRNLLEGICLPLHSARWHVSNLGAVVPPADTALKSVALSALVLIFKAILVEVVRTLTLAHNDHIQAKCPNGSLLEFVEEV